jgi:hypothetical protein
MTTVTDSFKKKYTELLLMDTVSQAQLAAKVNEFANFLNSVGVTPALSGFAAGTVIANAVTTASTSTVFDFGNNGPGGEMVRQPTLVRFVTTIGATPTATYNIQGSVDNTNWSTLTFSDSATPATFISTTFALTAAATTVKIVKAGQQYRYLRVVLTAVTNVTSTIDVVPLGD